MRGEGNEKNKEQEGTYFFKICPNCKTKLHMSAHFCLKCGGAYAENVSNVSNGNWVDTTYYSHNPEDAIYSRAMNKVEKCMTCLNVTQRGIICKPKYCFATARGRCDNCITFDPLIFECCQETLKEEGVVTREDIKAMNGLIKQIGSMPEPAAIPADQFDDDIPF